jgi:hypothetical protein
MIGVFSNWQLGYIRVYIYLTVGWFSIQLKRKVIVTVKTLEMRFVTSMSLKRITLLFCLLFLLAFAIATTPTLAQESCTSKLFKAYGLLEAAKAALEKNDPDTALQKTREAEQLLAECSSSPVATTRTATVRPTSTRGAAVVTATATRRVTSTPRPTNTPVSQSFATPDVSTSSFTTKDETLSFNYPSTDPASGDKWIVVELTESKSILLTNNINSSVNAIVNKPPESGDMWIRMIVTSGAVSSATIANTLETAVKSANSKVTVTAPKLFRTSGGRPGAYVDIRANNQRYILVDVGNRFSGLLIVTAQMSEIDSFMGQILIVINSIQKS